MSKRVPHKKAVGAASTSASLPYDNTLTGPTALGWTFYSTWLHCRREWWLRYVEGLLPIKKPIYFSEGEAYHALQEGVGERELAKRYEPSVLAEARRLHAARTLRGPPMAKAVSVEKSLVLRETSAAGLFTSKPDRVERAEPTRMSPRIVEVAGDRTTEWAPKATPQASPTTIREFKTTKWHGKFDSQKWDVSPQIIGELLCSGADSVIVDVVSKSATPETKQYVVRLNETKRIGFVSLITDCADEIERRLKASAADDCPGCPASFPPSMHNCAYPSLCTYYDYCWGGGACAAALFKRIRNDNWRAALRAAGRDV